ncbi:MAG: L,D-transpeptidase family protein [Gammaproteobacteria bacterium]
MSYVTAEKWIGVCLLGMVGINNTCHALTFPMPQNGNIVGSLQTTTARPGDTLGIVGLRYNIGGYEMKEANPGVPFGAPKVGSTLVIPSRFILPPGARKDIVINLAEMRLYYYHADGAHVSTFPVGVGQQGWTTPLGNTSILTKRKDPTWNVPESIWFNHLVKGQPIEKSVPPGPSNPLGRYAMNLGFTNIVIHGTPYPLAVGVRSSHGCIRMRNEDVEQLFSHVKIGTKVSIIHEPIKVGQDAGQLYMESHVPLGETMYPKSQNIRDLVMRTPHDRYRSFSIDWNTVDKVRAKSTGYPERFGTLGL